MLVYDEFKKKIKEEVTKEFGNDTEIKFHTIFKTNQVSYEGMTILGNDDCVMPIFPVETCYEEYRRGNICMDEVLRNVKEQMCTQPCEIEDIVDSIRQGTDVKEWIFMRVVNYEKNQEWLVNYPHRKRLDLAIMYYIGVDKHCSNMYVANINYALMSRMGLTEEELYDLAYENSRDKLPAVIKDIREIVSEILWERELDSEEKVMLETDEKMYVLTNGKKKFGAVCMFYEGVLEDFSERMQDDIFVLPSSIHETILLPSQGLNPEELRRIVIEVNQTMVEAEEVLGESVYIYKRKEKTLENVAIS